MTLSLETRGSRSLSRNEGLHPWGWGSLPSWGRRPLRLLRGECRLLK